MRSSPRVCTSLYPEINCRTSAALQRRSFALPPSKPRRGVISDQTKKRKHEAVEEPVARRQRLDDGSEGRSVKSVENWSTDQVAERLRDHGVGDGILQLFRG